MTSVPLFTSLQSRNPCPRQPLPWLSHGPASWAIPPNLPRAARRLLHPRPWLESEGRVTSFLVDVLCSGRVALSTGFLWGDDRSGGELPAPYPCLLARPSSRWPVYVTMVQPCIHRQAFGLPCSCERSYPWLPAPGL